MSNTNTPPLLYALTPIDQIERLESGEYIVVNKNGYPFLTKYKTTVPDGWVELDKPSNFTHYLRPLPEGTRVLQPGEVAVSEEELKYLRECKNKLSELETEYDRLHEEAMIWKYESGNT